MKLYHDPRSSSSLRVSCYLRFKGIEVEEHPISLIKREHLLDAYRDVNPSGSVPALELSDGTLLTQSLVLLEWLESRHPTPAALPSDDFQRAQVRALCSLIACDIHPLTNMRVRQRIEQVCPGETVQSWCQHWTAEGLNALEGWLARSRGEFAFGDRITLADFFVAPAVLNAENWGLALTDWPNVLQVWRNQLNEPAFAPILQFRTSPGDQTR